MKKERVLIIEDEKSIAKQLLWGLSDLYNISLAGDAVEAEALMSKEIFPVITLDLGLDPFPDSVEEGFRLLDVISDKMPFSKVIIITGNTDKENALKAIRMGAFDYCQKPIDIDVLKIILDRAFRVQRLEEENRRIVRHLSDSNSFGQIIGNSPQMLRLFSTIRKVSKTDFPVLIQGESGTGKEIIAQTVHKTSNRKKRPFIIINCGAIPTNLLESELFGHEKGSFTGAVYRKIGRLEEAQGGTVFLDEIGELVSPLQVKLLRFLQEGTIERVGGNRTIQLDVRILAATNIDLKQAVSEGKFREDLFFRINVIPLTLPPLRDRDEDILLLANYFLDRYCIELNKHKMRFSQDALKVMMLHPWTGNIREMQNIIKRAIIMAEGKEIDIAELGLILPENSEERQIPKPPLPVTLKETREMAEKRTIQQALVLNNHNITHAARLLDISRPTLHDLIKKYKINIR
ncbi:MAG: PEP-CTERM-box response regulator transcription factor [Nitrospirota bacterium]